MLIVDLAMKSLDVCMCMFLLLSATGCTGPIGPLSGGKLGGESVPYPDNWDVAVSTEHVQLETLDKEGQAHSVNIWCVVHNQRMYFTTSLVRGEEDPQSRRWVRYATDNNSARVRVDGLIYEGQLKRIEDVQLVSGVKEAFVAKYQTEIDDRNRNAWIFEFAET